MIIIGNSPRKKLENLGLNLNNQVNIYYRYVHGMVVYVLLLQIKTVMFEEIGRCIKITMVLRLNGIGKS